MVENAPSDRNEISRQATGWLILLQEEPDDVAIREGFQHWLESDPRHRAAWDDTIRADAVLAATAPRHASGWRPFLSGKRDGGRSRPARRRWMGLAGAAASLCLIALVLGPALIDRVEADFRTGTAETRIVTLADGSRVTLAPDSALALRGVAGERGVRLLSGEAFFEVSHDADHPFRVEGDGLRVTVLGTRFLVRQDGSGEEVGVEQGRVRVEAHTEQAQILEPGQIFQRDSHGHVRLSQSEVDQIAPWRQNRLIARNEPLSAVVASLRRYYSGQILILDDDLAARPVTGIYDLTDPIRALRAAARAQNASIRQISPWLTIVSAN